MTRDEIRAKIEILERSAMNDQPGWMEHLNGLSDQGREEALKVRLKRPDFERWQVLKMTLA